MKPWKAKYSTEHDYGTGQSFENHEEYILTEGDSLKEVENAIREVLAHGETFMGLGECTFLGFPKNGGSFREQKDFYESCKKCNERIKLLNKNVRTEEVK